MAKLSHSYEISDETRIAVRSAALLHDIGHGAFSHVIESILNCHHENFTVEDNEKLGFAINAQQ